MLSFKKIVGFRNPLETSIIIYLIVVIIIWCVKPRFLFDEDGNFKQFGVGQNKKTIFPLWLILVLLGVIIYFIIANVSAKEGRDLYCNKILGNPEEYKKIILDKCEFN